METATHWLSTFCAKESPLSDRITSQPWALDGSTWATDGRIAVMLHESIEGYASPSENVAGQIADVLAATANRPWKIVDVAAIKAWCGSVEASQRITCPDCSGAKTCECDECRGEGRSECHACGHETECENCDASGRVPCGCDDGFTVPEPGPGKFFGITLNRQLLAKALQHVDGEAKVSVGTQTQPIRLDAVRWTVLLMPLEADNVTEAFP